MVFRIDHVSLSDAAFDAPAPDAPGDVVAHYRFENPGPEITDETGAHHGTVVGTLTSVAGPPTYDMAVEFDGDSYITVPDSVDWDLGAGAIELRVRPSPSSMPVGLLSRDSTGAAGGQIALVQYGQSFFVVRFQLAVDSGVPGGGLFVCSDVVPSSTWMHIGINFGDPGVELWIDGVQQNAVRTFTLFNAQVSCSGGTEARSLRGNDDVWVFGALGVQSSPGTTDTITNPFSGGAIDEVVIHRTRQTFAR